VLGLLSFPGYFHWYPRWRRCRFARAGQIHLAAADGPIRPGSDQPGAHTPGPDGKNIEIVETGEYLVASNIHAGEGSALLDAPVFIGKH